MLFTRDHVKRLAPPLRLPLAAAAMLFLTAVLTTQIALYWERRESEMQLRQLGAVYLDGLAASVGAYISLGEMARVRERFTRALAEQHGIKERALFAFDAQGNVLARAGDSGVSEEEARDATRTPFRIDPSRGLAWASRTIGGQPGGTVVAALDAQEMFTARTRMLVGIVAVDLLIAALAGFIAYRVLRRLNRPFEVLTRQLEAAATGHAARVNERTMADSPTAIRALYRSFNRLLEAQRERERLAIDLAEQSQSAALGRLAATIAHEVRNPLAGLTTAVSTLRHFGERAEVRDKSLGFLERGLDAIDRIVTSTLNLYRPVNDRRLSPADFEDLEHLIQPAVKRAQLDLEWQVDVPQETTVGAAGVRQVLLNLLLNACAATPAGGRVGLRANVVDRALICIIYDQGEGMQPERARDLADGKSSPLDRRRIGMDVIIALLGDLDGRASVTSMPDKGTTVRVCIPLREDT
ncbi:MAG: sensor histidine kinase [Hyphomicrobiaceae bacterium]